MKTQTLLRYLAPILILGVLVALCSHFLVSALQGGLLLTLALGAAPLAWWVVTRAERWVEVFLAAALLLPPVPFPWGDAGVHPALFFAATGLWAGVVRSGSWQFLRRPVSAAACFLLLALLLSVPSAAIYSGAEMALGSLARVALFSISIYVFFYLADGPGRGFPTGRLVRLFLWTGMLSAGFACLDFYFQFPATARFAEQFVWLPGGVFRRAQGVFYEASTLGLLSVFLLVMIASVAAHRLWREFQIKPAWLLAGGITLMASLVLSFSRAALVSLGLSLGLMLVLSGRRSDVLRKYARIGASVVALACGAGAILYWHLPDFLMASGSRLWYSGVYFLESPNLILSRRLESWAFLLEYLSAHPWRAIFGIGYKTLPYSDVVGRPVVADNMYLSVLVETGVAGLTAVLLLHVAVLRAAYRVASSGGHSKDDEVRRMTGTWLFCFWCGFALQMTSGDVLTYWRILPAFFALAAVAVREADDEDPVS